MSQRMKIDFVSDVSCPWCVIGLKGLEQALERAGDVVEAGIRFQPFQLNPGMPAEGQLLVDYAAQRYGSTAEQLAERRKMIRERAADLGFTIALSPEKGRVYNTFDAHRLLHWAGLGGKQRELKLALFEAYFTKNLNPGDHEVLIDAAEATGLDRAEAADVLETGRYADEVRSAELHWRSLGISGVPAVIINDRYMISGGQASAVFENAIRRIAAEDAAQTPAS